MIKKKGQIWVETVIYTLIGLSLIALVLAIIAPKINESKDKAVIEQTISSLNILDSKIYEVLAAPGNVRVVEFQMRRGELNINPQNDSIFFELRDSRSLFSEPGVEIPFGRISINTTEGRKEHTVRLSLFYNFDLQYGNSTNVERITAASTPYKFSIENIGNSTVNIARIS